MSKVASWLTFPFNSGSKKRQCISHQTTTTETDKWQIQFSIEITKLFTCSLRPYSDFSLPFVNYLWIFDVQCWTLENSFSAFFWTTETISAPRALNRWAFDVGFLLFSNNKKQRSLIRSFHFAHSVRQLRLYWLGVKQVLLNSLQKSPRRSRKANSKFCSRH